jgi:hypothetical protein
MSISHAKSSTSKNSTRIRTMNQPFPQDHLCRFLLAGNRRCQRVRGCTGSGLCILHDRQLMQLRDAESKSLGDAALGQVTDFNSAVAIHAVLSRVVILGLQRRYTTKEVSVFTYAIQSLRQTLDEAAYEIRHHLGHDSRDHYVGQAIGKEPSLRQPRQRKAHVPAPAPTVKTSDGNSVIVDPDDIADVMNHNYISSQAQESVDNLLSLNTTQNSANASVAAAQAPVGARLGRDSGQASPTAASANCASIANPQSPEIPSPSSEEEIPQPQSIPANAPPQQSLAQDLNDDSIPYTHMQTYGGISIPLQGRLHGGAPEIKHPSSTEPTPRPVKFFRARKPNR